MAVRSVIWPSGVTITTAIPRRDAHVEGVAGARGGAARKRRERDHQHRPRIEHLNVSPRGRRGGRSAPVRWALLDQPAELAGDLASDAIGPTRGAMHDQRGRGAQHTVSRHVHNNRVQLLFTYTTSLSGNNNNKRASSDDHVHAA